ncbi:flavin reductase family protein [Stenotrophomonas sp. LGBM10]|uniref:flavin reductase family protein n=1 Tax=Stenotrophomonas sp. LGBM10 TaxID=3390038 RepID=UPI00398A989E
MDAGPALDHAGAPADAPALDLPGAPALSAAALRHAFGQYPTGVAVVTTHRADAALRAMTINSFASLSLAPPLIVWSLCGHSQDLPLYRAGQPFGISILSAGQTAIARHFADGRLRHAALPEAMTRHASGIAVVRGAVAHLLCTVERTLPGGDHVMIVGRVAHVETAPADTLAFHRGRYAHLKAP